MTIYAICLMDGTVTLRTYTKRYEDEKTALRKRDELNQYTKGNARWVVLCAEDWRVVE